MTRCSLTCLSQKSINSRIFLNNIDFIGVFFLHLNLSKQWERLPCSGYRIMYIKQMIIRHEWRGVHRSTGALKREKSTSYGQVKVKKSITVCVAELFS